MPSDIPITQEESYAEGRADQLEEDLRLLEWAYRKLIHFSFTRQEDALMMDEINYLLMTRPIRALTKDHNP